MSHYTIVVPVRPIQEIWSFLYPFTFEVWIWLVITIPCLILSMWVANHHATIDLETILGFVTRVAMVDDGRFMLKIFDLKGNLLLNMLGILWIWACLVLNESYKGNLTAMLTRPTLKKTINSVEDLLNQDEIKWAIDDNGLDITEYLKASPKAFPKKVIFRISLDCLLMLMLMSLFCGLFLILPADYEQAT